MLKFQQMKSLDEGKQTGYSCLFNKITPKSISDKKTSEKI